MSVFSARERLSQISDTAGYCLPLAVDSAMRYAELPQKYYDMFKVGNESGGSCFNDLISKLIKDFFKVEPQPDTHTAPVAMYNAFGASPQVYCPDADYDYTDQLKVWKKTLVTPKQLRIRDLIKNAAENRCLVIVELASETGSHVGGLELVEPGIDSGYTAQYLMRDQSYLKGGPYDSNDLSGISSALGETADGCVPLDEFGAPWYPAGETSPCLLILPPEPK